MRADENMKAELADQNAKIDYLAMMADIEFRKQETRQPAPKKVRKSNMAKAKEVTEAVDTSAEETIQEEVQHSDWFDRIKDYYDTKRWNLAMVKNAVKKGKITEEEYEEVTGRKYKA